MEKKKWILGSTVLFLAVTLTGCGSIDLTDKESDMIATYAASTLLNQIADYPDRLALSASGSAITPETVTPSAVATLEPQQTAQPQATGEPSSTTNPQTSSSQNSPQASDDGMKEVDMNTLYHVRGAQFSYKSFEFCKQYPKKNSAYQILANKEEILFIVKFSVRNASGKNLSVNLMNRRISYPLSVDGFEYKPTISVLENGGLNFLSTKIKAGKSEEAVLVYSVPRKVTAAKELSVRIEDVKNKSTVKLN